MLNMVFQISVGGNDLLDTLNRSFVESQTENSGPPPASKEVIKNLPILKATEEIITLQKDCAICQDLFAKDDEITKLPCKHFYHVKCVMPWLELHGTCPTCRHVLDPEKPLDEPKGNNFIPPSNNNFENVSISESEILSVDFDPNEIIGILRGLYSSTNLSWNCEICTFENNGIMGHCEMCGTQKQKMWSCPMCTVLNPEILEECKICETKREV